MCEFCGEVDTRIELYPGTKGETCEWFPDPDEDTAEGVEAGFCSNVPAYRIVEIYIEEHLCNQHMQEERLRSQRYIDDILAETGLGESEFVPIREESECEYFDELAALRMESSPPCRERARFARRVRLETLMCREHAALEGNLSQGAAERQKTVTFQEPEWRKVEAEILLKYCSWCHGEVDPDKEVFGLQAAVHENVRLPRGKMDGFEVPLLEENRTAAAILSRRGSEAHREGVDLMFMTCCHDCALNLQNALKRQSMLFSTVRFG